ncbi:hypothetical protein [Nostoc sp.]|uniref:hypothetical protein n=1 Tax=Nostoc sp. TaxID=1180 RepID=UPI002FF9C520
MILGASHFCKNTLTLAIRNRSYTDKTHLRGFQIPEVRATVMYFYQNLELNQNSDRLVHHQVAKGLPEGRLVVL